MLVCGFLEFVFVTLTGTLAVFILWLIVSTASQTGRFAVSILAGTPSALALSIVIYGMWHLGTMFGVVMLPVCSVET